MAKPSESPAPSAAPAAKTLPSTSASSPTPGYPLGFIFVLWKGTLLLLALFSSLAPSYDTSTSLLFASTAASYTVDDGNLPTAHSAIVLIFERLPFIGTIVERLTRWDALYFVKSAQRGYIFEQEWAFARGQPMIVKTLLRGCESMAIELGLHGDRLTAALGVAVSIAAHLYAAQALQKLVRDISGSKKLGYLSAVLHVVSPTGMFLTAPYAEGPFAYLAFTGLLKYAEGLKMERGSWGRCKATVWSGVLLGLATACRANGLLYGIVFAWDMIEGLLSFSGTEKKMSLLVSLVAIGIAGVSVGAGSAIPQLVGYLTFCGQNAAEPREWCSHTIPSIYSYVQTRYWNVGFLRYWVPGNIPLFALAFPMLYILTVSAKDVLVPKKPPTKCSRMISMVHVNDKSPYSGFIKSLAIGQVILAVMAFTSYHVQIITRISSGYPLWYVWVAEQLADTRDPEKVMLGRRVVMYMVGYALIQGVLYVCFLPPA